MTTRDVVLSIFDSQFVLGLLVLCAGVVGAVAIGVPWIRWSQKRKAKPPQADIIVLLDWVDRMSTEQRMEHLQQRVQKRKRERVVIH